MKRKEEMFSQGPYKWARSERLKARCVWHEAMLSGSRVPLFDHIDEVTGAMVDCTDVGTDYFCAPLMDVGGAQTQ